MKKISWLLMGVLILLSACRKTKSSTEVSDSSFLTNSSQSDSLNNSSLNGGISSPGSSLPDSSLPNSSSSVSTITTIAQAKIMSETLTGTDVEGETIQIKGRFLYYYADGGTYHVGAFSDGDAMIQVRHMISDSTKYNYAVDSSYIVTAKVSKRNSNPELMTIGQWQKTTSITVDAFALTSPVASIADLHTEIKSLSLSNKGCAFTRAVSFTAQYIQKIDNTQLLVYDGNNLISIHGDNKINNGFTIGAHYNFAGIIGMYIYKPSIGFLAANRVSDGTKPTTFTNVKEVTVNDFYRLEAADEKQAFFPTVLKFTGYVRAYQSLDNFDYFVFSDTATGRIFWQSGDVYNAKALFIRNHDLIATNPFFQSLVEVVETDIQISFYLSLYQYITGNHAWHVHIIASFN